VLRRIFGPTRENVIGECKKNLHNEELTDLYYSPNVIRVIKSRRMRKVGHAVRTVEKRGVYRVLVGKSEGKSPLGRPRRRWKDNINPFQPNDAIWHHTFHLPLICMSFAQ